MKIHIGPFIDRWTTQSFEDWWMEKRTGKHRWDIEDADYKPLDRFVEELCDGWQSVLNFTINRYLDNKKRKIDIRLDNYDTWNMDHTLGLIILPMLKQLKDTKHGSPLVDDEDVPEGMGLRSTEAPECEDWETDDNVHKRWEWVMDELIWTFTQLTDDNNEDQFHSGTIDFEFVPCEDRPGYSEMVKGPNDTHVFDRAGFDKHQERINNGLRLFGKYYRGLWD